MIYFDNNATTMVAPGVFEAMKPYLSEFYGNPSSSYEPGRQSHAAIEEAREKTAALLGAATPEEIVFTSGGTESDNWAIFGALEANPSKRHVITTRVEHEAVLNVCKKLEPRGFEVVWLDVGEDGFLDPDELREMLREDTAVVSVMLANNETGILFPVDELAGIVHANSNALFHVDGVNAAGKISIDLKNSGVDLFSISAHKFHGPKGVGALYIKNGTELPPNAIGGGQEMGRRAGTEAVHQIVGLGIAAEMAANLSEMTRVGALRDRLENEILEKIPNSCINGTADRAKRLPNTTSISFPNLNGEAILARLNDLDVYVSTGSACNAASHTPSRVLQAMNIPYQTAMGAIRFSLGRYNTADEVDFVLEKLPKIIADLTKISPAGGSL